NIYYAGTPSTNNVIFYGYNSSAPAIDATLEAYKTRTQTFDQNSYTEDVQFVANDDLHIPPLNTTIARGNAQPITNPIAITNDFDGMNRDVLNPDIGADELPNAFPSSAVDPQPINEATAVAVGLTSLQWKYVSSLEYLDPLTFKVYLNTSPDFTGIEPLGLVTFQQGVENYTFNLSGGAPLSYETAYYWKVVPTLDANSGPDAPEVSVWQFTTEIFVFPYPNTATNPLPTGNELVSVELLNLQWEFIKLNNYTSPAGFKVYLGLNAVPGASDLIAWVPFTENITNYSASLSAINLDYNTTYYWKVVPTIDQNNGPDAEGVLVWSFTTSGYPYPNVATNPDPANGGIYEISDVIQVVLNWDYTPNPDYALPVSFKVFIGTDTTAT
ncbi:MAG: hypothetical protein Q8T08_17870, partial [Ignavibacteria bacterium]|nr:hypothetical protein [Ignavibacteria bacterium]